MEIGMSPLNVDAPTGFNLDPDQLAVCVLRVYEEVPSRDLPMKLCRDL